MKLLPVSLLLDILSSKQDFIVCYVIFITSQASPLSLQSGHEGGCSASASGSAGYVVIVRYGITDDPIRYGFAFTFTYAACCICFLNSVTAVKAPHDTAPPPFLALKTLTTWHPRD
jgi:hypothetical protein